MWQKHVICMQVKEIATTGNFGPFAPLTKKSGKPAFCKVFFQILDRWKEQKYSPVFFLLRCFIINICAIGRSIIPTDFSFLRVSVDARVRQRTILVPLEFKYRIIHKRRIENV